MPFHRHLGFGYLILEGGELYSVAKAHRKGVTDIMLRGVPLDPAGPPMDFDSRPKPRLS